MKFFTTFVLTIILAVCGLTALPVQAQTVNALGTGFLNPVGVAVDATGNVFVADANNNAVKEILAIDGSTINLGGTFIDPEGIAIDVNGNVFVADFGDGTIQEILAVSGSVPASPTINTVATGFMDPFGIAIDSSGDLFVSDPGANAVFELVAVSGVVTPATVHTPIASGFVVPEGLALDSSGNLYVANNDLVQQVVAPAYTTVNTLPTPVGTFTSPSGVAIDAQGNVLVSNAGDNTINKILAASGFTTVTTIAPAFIFSNPLGIAVDANGNVFVGDTGNSAVEEILTATTTTVMSSLNPSTVGTSVTFTATVSVSADTPSGTVAFFDGVTSLGSGPLVSGVATLTTSSLALGAHSITGVYSGDNFAASTSPALTQTVNATATTTTLISSVNPSPAGTSVTFTATVSGTGGTVTFMDGVTAISGAVNVVSNTATFSTAALAVGSHSITAVYSGSGSFAASTSTVLTQVVNLVATTTTLISSVNPSTVGQSVTLTATVTGTGGGTVTFMDGVTTLGSPVTVASGTASLSTAALALGSHSITAVYSGGGNFAGSTSTVLTQVVNAAPTSATTTTLTSSNNPSAPGRPVIFTAFVASLSGSPTGTVTFKDGSTVLGTGTVASGEASFTTATLIAGGHSITAVYGGSVAFAASTSAALTQTVGPTTGDVYSYQSTIGVTGTIGTDNAHFSGPVVGSVDTVNGHLLVADTGNDRVQIIDTGTLAVVATIGVTGVTGTDNAHLNQPGGVGFDATTDHIFVADTLNQRIQIFDAKSLAFVASLGVTGVTGTDNGHFNLPAGVHVNGAAGQLYVADTGNQRVQIFNTGTLAYVTTLGTSGAVGTDNAHFNQPSDAEVDVSTNQIMVADSGNARVQIFDATSFAYKITLGTTGVTGADDSHFTLPVSAAFDSLSNLILVADGGANARVQVFDALTYNYILTLGTVGSAGPANTQFATPRGVAVDPAHKLAFIGDGTNDRVQVFAIAPTVLLAAVLPDSRSVQVGSSATIFATIINAGATALNDCQITLPVTAPSGLTLTFQTTSPSTNTLTGTINTPVAIAGNDGAQTFLISFLGTTAFSAPGQPLDFDCAGAAPAAIVIGVDTVDLVMSSTPIADIIALSATATNNGVVEVPNGGVGAFAVASFNVGSTAPITVSVDTGTATLPVVATICQSNPTTAQCLAPPTASVTLPNFATDEAPTFSIFVQATAAIPFSPGTSRVFVRFKDASGGLHGSTSVAIETE